MSIKHNLLNNEGPLTAANSAQYTRPLQAMDQSGTRQAVWVGGSERSRASFLDTSSLRFAQFPHETTSFIEWAKAHASYLLKDSELLWSSRAKIKNVMRINDLALGPYTCAMLMCLFVSGMQVVRPRCMCACMSLPIKCPQFDTGIRMEKWTQLASPGIVNGHPRKPPYVPKYLRTATHDF